MRLAMCNLLFRLVSPAGILDVPFLGFDGGAGKNRGAYCLLGIVAGLLLVNNLQAETLARDLLSDELFTVDGTQVGGLG